MPKQTSSMLSHEAVRTHHDTVSSNKFSLLTDVVNSKNNSKTSNTGKEKTDRGEKLLEPTVAAFVVIVVVVVVAVIVVAAIMVRGTVALSKSMLKPSAISKSAHSLQDQCSSLAQSCKTVGVDIIVVVVADVVVQQKDGNVDVAKLAQKLLSTAQPHGPLKKLSTFTLGETF